MGFGFPEFIIIAIAIYVWFSVTKGKNVKNLLPKDKIKSVRETFKSFLYDVKDVEFEIKDTVSEVEEEVSLKHKRNKDETKKQIKKE